MAMGWALLAGIDLLQRQPQIVPQWTGTPPWLAWADLVAGVVLSAALWWRRRFPVQLAVAGMLVTAFSVTVFVAALIVLFTVGVHRRFTVTALIAAGSLAGNVAFVLLRPEAGTSVVELMAWSTLFVTVVGDRAEQAEAEQELRVQQARQVERTRIAREMHDVLAHRISLLSLHAGALEIRPDAAPAEVAGAAGIIRASAHQALQDLREVIGVLREPAGDDAPERPQPTLRELPALADESRAAGVKVRLDLRIDEPGEVPAATGRAAYRIVQEGLTNARKHAPGACVRVRVAGAPGPGLTVEIRNPAPVGLRPVAAIPGTGTGLVGLAERATLAGGRLTAGRGPDGGFTLTAWLPWPQLGETP